MFEFLFHGLHRLKKKYASKLNLAELPVISYLRKQIIFRLRKKVVENVNGYTMHVDDKDSLALSWHHVFEPITTDFFKNNIFSGQTVIDIGANIGYFTLLFSGLVGKEGHVYAFEPEPENVILLRKNLEINSISNVTVIEMAISNEKATCKLFINKKNRGNHQIFNSETNREFVDIQTTTLDAYFADQKIKIDWIKMDIEGAELLALQGMKSLIYKNPKMVLVTEIFAPGLLAAGTSVEEYVNAMNEMNFEISLVDERLKKINPICYKDLIRSVSSNDNVYPNIVCRRKEIGKINN